MGRGPTFFDDLMRDIAADFRNGLPHGNSMLPDQRSKPVEQGSGWVEPRPVRPPDGVRLVDVMCDTQDAIDQREKLRSLVGQVGGRRGWEGVSGGRACQRTFN